MVRKLVAFVVAVVVAHFFAVVNVRGRVESSRFSRLRIVTTNFGTRD